MHVINCLQVWFTPVFAARIAQRWAERVGTLDWVYTCSLASAQLCVAFWTTSELAKYLQNGSLDPDQTCGDRKSRPYDLRRRIRSPGLQFGASLLRIIYAMYVTASTFLALARTPLSLYARACVAAFSILYYVFRNFSGFFTASWSQKFCIPFILLGHFATCIMLWC